MTTSPVHHWEAVWRGRAADTMSWFETEPTESLHMIDALGLGRDASVVDVGAGSARLTDRLLDRGHTDVTVVDASEIALDDLRARLGPRAASVTFVPTDVLDWQPRRTFDLWHDRAVFHFLTAAADRTRYVTLATRAVRPGGGLVVGTFAPEGPEQCSGLRVVRYGSDTLAACFGTGFAVVAAERLAHVTPAGGEQWFTWVALRRIPERAAT